MIEEIVDNLYRVKVPLPDSPLKTLNSYFIKGKPRSLVIDTGLNHPACLEAMNQAFDDLGLRPEETDFFITHFHADHLGLVSKLVGPEAKVYLNRPDASRLKEPGRWEAMVEYAGRCGFPAQAMKTLVEQHPAWKHGRDYRLVDFTPVEDNDPISAGGFSFNCLATPGHTPGHTCLYEPERKLLIAGDHILEDISPHIQLWSGDENPLAQYLESLDRVAGLEIDLVLPGHRRLIRDCRGRIETLRRHHRQRLDEVLGLLDSRGHDPFTVASRMSWDIGRDWERFPVTQKWFATGEAVAHLKYLEDEGLAVRRNSSPLVAFSRRD